MYHTNCIICHSNQLIELPEYKKACLVKCNNCNFVFAKKKPLVEDLIKHYFNYPRYTDISFITKKRYDALLDSFEKYRKTNNIIDLGCSNGLFLQCAKERGWNVYGTEFAEECIEYCMRKGITVFKSDQLPTELFNIKFDIVTSFEVIEHINNPNEEMELVTSLLRSGGIFYFTTPNFNSISRFILKEKWNIIEYPEHLSYYTSKTIHSLMKKHCLIKQYITTTGISLSRFNESIGKKEENRTITINTDETLRIKLENNGFLFQLKRIANFSLNLFKIGDAMKGLYLKP